MYWLEDDSAVEFPEDEFDQVMQANFKSVWTMSQAAAKHMIPKGSGKIISTASLMSFQVCLFVIPVIEMDYL